MDVPACFNTKATELGKNVVSIDPVYQFSSKEISSRIDDVFPQIMSQVKKNVDDFIWNKITNIEELGNIRMRAMKLFLKDYEFGKKSGRYINASLPQLPFDDCEYDLSLCSHYLFLYSEQVDLNQHILSMK